MLVAGTTPLSPTETMNRNVLAPHGAVVVLALTTTVFAQSAWVAQQTDAPNDRGACNVAYDSHHGRLVLFGGEHGYQAAETWTHDGTTWLRRTPVVSPPPTSGHAMAYDPLRRRTVVFGGTSQGALVDTTWEWDGFAWTQVHPVARPDARQHGAMCFDPVSGRILLFGGHDGTVERSDLWAWDGSTWSVLPTAQAPTPRQGHAMAFLPTRNRVVLFGGSRQTASVSPLFEHYNDTYEWTGSTWIHRAAALRPPARQHAAMCCDLQRNVLVLYGGEVRGQPVLVPAATWEWDGAAWTQRTAATTGTMSMFHGGARAFCRMAYDPVRGVPTLFTRGHLLTFDGVDWRNVPTTLGASATTLAYDERRGRTVRFGGGPHDGTVPTTWERLAGTWVARRPVSSPDHRIGHALAFDGTGVLLFSGDNYHTGLRRDDTWRWDGTTWQQLTPVHTPGARHGHAMAYDRLRQRVVLYGGSTLTTGLTADTWEWDGTDWLRAATASPLGPRAGHAMTYDRRRARIQLCGGRNDQGVVPATLWEWNGSTWSGTSTAGLPPTRKGAALVYDDERAVTVLLGGTADFGSPRDDFWEWNGATWSARVLTPRPRPRHSCGAAYDFRRARLVVHGGTGWEGGTTSYVYIVDYGDTWEHGTAGAAVAAEYGVGCGSPALTAAAATGSRPILGQAQTIDVDGAPGGLALMAYGWSDSSLGGTPLPLQLDGFGLTGCTLFHSLDRLAEPCTPTAPNRARHVATIANLPHLLGLQVYLQAWAPAAGQNPAGVIASNGVSLYFGDR
jgi:hypothetical protein